MNVKNGLLQLFFWLLAIVCLLPFWLVLSVSFTDENAILRHGYALLPKVFSWEGYYYLFLNSTAMLRALGISVLITASGTIISLLISSLYAYAISRRDFPYQRVMTFFMFFTLLFNGGLVPWYLVYTNLFSLNNSLLALLIPNLLMNGFLVTILRTFFMTTIPFSIIESAYMDGAGENRIFFRIVFPLSLPVMAVVGLFTTFNYWNDWMNSLVFISDNKLYNLQYFMNNILMNIAFLKQNLSNLGSSAASYQIPTESARMAMAICGIGPIMLVYPFIQKYFVKGLTVGAIKG